MTKIFLTGDRSLDPVVSVLAVSQVLVALAQADPLMRVDEVVTGDLGGVEAAVRYLVPGSTIVESTALADGKPDLNARHEAVRPQVEGAIFLHPDPLESSVLASLVEYFDDDALQVVPLG